MDLYHLKVPYKINEINNYEQNQKNKIKYSIILQNVE